MDTKYLSTFLTVVRCGGYNKATKELHYSQSTVSHQIAELEDELGFKLFTHEPRSCALTELGALFVPKAQNMITFYDTTIHECQQYKNNADKAAVLKFAVWFGLTTDIYRKTIRILWDKEPERMQGCLAYAKPQSALQSIAEGICDCCFYFKPLEELDELPYLQEFFDSRINKQVLRPFVYVCLSRLSR